MTVAEVKKIINEFEQAEIPSAIIAGKLIRLDLLSIGVDEWLKRDASDIACDFVDIADAAMTKVVDHIGANAALDKLVSDVGLEPSEQFDFEQIQNFKSSVLDTFEVLATYLRIHELAKQTNHESNT